ncbi:MAG: hypothetical protein ACOYMA_19065 [Bacteroidia bacterium]
MKIIKNYWSDKIEQQISETAFLNHIEKHEIKTVYIGFTPIKNFKIDIEDGRMVLRYAAPRGKNLKYYANLLNHSICVHENTAIFLQDANWSDYNNQILNEQTKNLLQ